MTYEVQQNPWGLTPGQCATLDALVRAGCGKGAADALGISIKTVASQLLQAKKRMGARTILLALLMWDRLERAK